MVLPEWKELKMDKVTAEQTIAISIIENTINSLDEKLTDTSSLKKQVKYHGKKLNESMAKDFNQITEILQSVVNAFYYNSYIVDSFIAFHLEDFDFCVKHNYSLLNSMKKLLKFVG